MRRQTKPRRRPMRNRCRNPAPGKFWISGYPACDGDNLYPVRRMLTWDHGALSGDPAMVAAAIARAGALRDDLAEWDRAHALLVALYLPRALEQGGDLPASP